MTSRRVPVPDAPWYGARPGALDVTRLRPWVLVLVGGVLLPISFCGFDQWYLTWIAFVPLLAAIEGVGRGRAALLGFVYGLIANQIGYYWIPYTIHVFGGFPAVLAGLFSLALCSYQAVQYMLLAYLVVRLRERGWSPLWVVPATMVGLETVFPLLFPIFMGNTQHPVPLLIQSCDLLGPLGITAVIMLFNVSVHLGLRAAFRKEPVPWRQVAAGPAGVLLLVVYGAIRMPVVESWVERSGVPLELGVIQPNMGIEEKWSDVEKGLQIHREAAMDLERRGAELIVWSEAAFTKGYVLPEERNLRHRLVPRIRTPMLVGALTRRDTEVCGFREGDLRCRPERRTFNSAFILDAEGDIEGTYDKHYLLAFGEYLPFGDVFPQLHDYSPNSGNMNAGTRIDALPFPHRGRDWALSVLICYEDILPGFTRDLVRHGNPDLLINMTNDAWFGDSNEPWIHMDLAKFRAVEHRRYLVRATNTGVSAVIDPLGRLVAHTSVFRQEDILTTVRLLRGARTVYALVGDVLGYVALAVLGLGLWLTRRVWLVTPTEKGRRGVTQAAAMLLVTGCLDAVFLGLTWLARPAGWEIGRPEVVLWPFAVVAAIASFVLLRRRSRWGLRAAWAGGVARIVVAIVLVPVFVQVDQLGVAVTSAAPAVTTLLAGVNLWLWRSRCRH
jgi:apolipoprotein N-acyltransferase